MKTEFCNYNQSLALKELGFDEPCFVYFRSYTNFNLAYANTGITTNTQLSKGDSSNITAPLKQQCMRWFREKHKLFPEISSYTEKYMDGKVKFNFEIRDNGEQYEFQEGPWILYEEAEDACIDKLIEIIKNK